MRPSPISAMHTVSWIISACLHLLFLHGNVAGMTMDKAILDAAPNAEMFDAFHLMPQGEVMIMTELDLLLSLDQYRKLYRPSKSRETRKALKDTSLRWTNCKVYYEITESLNTTEIRQVIKQAMTKWESYSCLSFSESSTARSRIQFQDGGGCYSELGMKPKPQLLVLAPGCRTEGIIVHEIGHAIGWIHEHMRPDRDLYIYINEDVIPPKFKPNFVKYNSETLNMYDIPYDYTSIMHYGNGALNNSIVTLDPTYQDKIGQRRGLTFKDIKLANLMYNCPKVMGCGDKTCNYGGFVFYKEHKGAPRCECWCDSNNVEDPLVLCSTIDKDPEGPKTKPAVVPAVAVCRDVRADCQRLKRTDSNVCMNRMKMMMSVCSKTCDFCGKGEKICMDHDNGCPLFKASKACEDEGMKSIMKELCPASCGACTPTDACSVQSELMGTQRNIGAISTWLLGCVAAGLSLSLRSGLLRTLELI